MPRGAAARPGRRADRAAVRGRSAGRPSAAARGVPPGARCRGRERPAGGARAGAVRRRARRSPAPAVPVRGGVGWLVSRAGGRCRRVGRGRALFGGGRAVARCLRLRRVAGCRGRGAVAGRRWHGRLLSGAGGAVAGGLRVAGGGVALVRVPGGRPEGGRGRCLLPGARRRGRLRGSRWRRSAVPRTAVRRRGRPDTEVVLGGRVRRRGRHPQVRAADTAEAVVVLQGFPAAGAGGELVELRHRHTHVFGRKRLAASTSSVRSSLVGASRASRR